MMSMNREMIVAKVLQRGYEGRGPLLIDTHGGKVGLLHQGENRGKGEVKRVESLEIGQYVVVVLSEGSAAHYGEYTYWLGDLASPDLLTRV